eukprot:gene11486-biopygen6371
MPGASRTIEFEETPASWTRPRLFHPQGERRVRAARVAEALRRGRVRLRALWKKRRCPQPRPAPVSLKKKSCVRPASGLGEQDMLAPRPPLKAKTRAYSPRHARASVLFPLRPIRARVRFSLPRWQTHPPNGTPLGDAAKRPNCDRAPRHCANVLRRWAPAPRQGEQDTGAGVARAPRGRAAGHWAYLWLG